MPKNQSMIMSKLIESGKENILLSTKVEGNDLIVKDRGSSKWVPHAEFIKEELVSA